jgi:hypothetical protein
MDCVSIPEVKRSETAWDARQKNAVDFRQRVLTRNNCINFISYFIKKRNLYARAGNFTCGVERSGKGFYGM